MVFIPIIGSRVYLADSKQEVNFSCGELFHTFSTDEELSYVPFCDDFGPMNLYCVLRFVEILEKKLIDFPAQKIVYLYATSQRNLTNAAFLLGSYMIIKIGLKPNDVASAFCKLEPYFVPYRDASYTYQDYFLELLDCWRGLARANHFGWLMSYNMDEYRHYDSPIEGDLHVLVPGKLVAFRGPRTIDGTKDYEDNGYSRVFAPRFYVGPFEDMGVSTVVRLNEPHYAASEFTSHGIVCVDLEFEDCAPPSADIVLAFMQTVAHAPAAVAVHCKAGLGRTGTLAAVYLICAHGFSAREAMGWLRIVRPGSVIGDQQHFLETFEVLWREETSQPSDATHDSSPDRQFKSQDVNAVTETCSDRDASHRNGATDVRVSVGGPSLRPLSSSSGSGWARASAPVGPLTPSPCRISDRVADSDVHRLGTFRSRGGSGDSEDKRRQLIAGQIGAAADSEEHTIRKLRQLSVASGAR